MPSPESSHNPEPHDMFSEVDNTQATPVIPQSSLQPPASPIPPKKKSPAILIGVIVFVLLLLAGGAWGAYYWYTSPQRVLAKSNEQLMQLHSFEFSATLSTPKKENFLSVKGASDTTDAATPKSTAVVTVVSPDEKNSTISFEIRTIRQMIYGQLVDAPTSPFLPLDKLKNTWIQIDQEMLENLPLPADAKGIQLNFSENKLTEEDQQKIREAYLRHPYFVLQRSTGKTSIYNTNVHMYPFSVDQTAMMQFMQEIEPVLEKKLSKELLTNINSSLQQVESSQGEFWVDLKTNQMHKMDITVTMKEDDQDSPAHVSVELWNYNGSVNIEEPKNAQSISSLLQLLLGGSTDDTTDTTMPSTNDTTRLDQNADTDSDGLTNAEEGIYGTDPSNADSDSDGYIDGQEVSTGHNPLGDGTVQPPTVELQ